MSTPKVLLGIAAAVFVLAVGAAAQQPVVTATGVPATLAQEQVFSIWDGAAPGSEGSTPANAGAGGTAGTATQPTLTAYPADPSKASGTAVIVCPGGAFRALSMQDEGSAVAEWLNDHGISAFVLKYHLLSGDGGGGRRGGRGMPMGGLPRNLEIKNANANPEPDNVELANVVKLATADGRQAIKLVRANAAKWNINPKKIGIMGFSAGGGVAVGSVLGAEPDSKADFIVTLYGPALVDVNVPSDAPPLFIAVAADHQPVANGLIALYTVWKAAGKSAEIHIYANGRAGFGMRKQGLPSDTWIERCYDWMKVQGFAEQAK